jgi:shikimate kinase
MSSSLDSRPIALVGLMGAGKSVVASLIGERLGARVVDLDRWLEAEEGSTVAEYFAARGEPEFRRREAELLGLAIDSGAGVLACGGGVVLDAGSRARLTADCRSVWLQVSPARAAARAVRDGNTRPLLGAGAAEPRLATLLLERAPLYREVAALEVATDDKTPAEVAEAVIAALASEARS